MRTSCPTPTAKNSSFMKSAWLIAFLIISILGINPNKSLAQYSTIAVTGFTADVIANGSTFTAGTTTTADVDGGGYYFLDQTFTAFGAPTYYLPTSGTINSVATSGLSFQLASSSANNSLRLATQNATGTLTLTSPTSAGTLYILATSGTGISTVDMTVTFSDATTQIFSGQSINDWYNGTGFAIQGIGRTTATALDAAGGTTNPRLYQVALAISAANYTKLISSITFTKTSATGTGYTQIMAVSALSPCFAPSNQATGLSLTATSTTQITGSFTAATSTPTGYLVVRYPHSAVTTAPVNGTTYIAGGALGLGYVISSGATTTLSAVGLSAGTTYDFYIYSYSNGVCAGGPIYNSTSPLTGSQTTNSCGGTLTGIIPVGPTAPASPAGFSTLTAAITYITANGLAGNTVLELQSDYTSTTETYPITFPLNPCIGVTKTLTVRPASAATGLLIASSNATATIDLNAATNITIDGRPGGVGTTSQLTIIDSSTAGVAVRFINDASNNKITYCDIQGRNSSATSSALSGVIYAGTTTTTNLTGNDNDTLSYNKIHAIASVGNPAIGIVCYGNVTSTTAYNDNWVVTNNNIYDFFSATLASTGVKLDIGSNAWTLTNNSIYQTATRTYTSANTHRGFWVTPNTGSIANTASGFIITGNYIGGSTPNAGGVADSLTSTVATNFYGMDLSVGAGTATSVQNNKISNIYLGTASTTTLSSGGAFIGIGIANGILNIGTTTGNLIGSSTVNNSITIKLSANASASTGIRIGSSNSATVANNTIAGITNIGAAVTNYGGLNGIGTAGGTIVSITNDTIFNLINLSNTTTATSASAQVVGINVPTGLATPIVTSNVVHDLSNYSLNVGTGTSASIIGIFLNSTSSTNSTISSNKVYNLINTGTSTSATYAPSVWGILVNGSTTGIHIVSKNLIHSFSIPNWIPSATPTGTPILGGIGLNSGAVNVSNNMVRLGIDGTGAAVTGVIQFIGINKNNAQNNNIWYNSVYIGGTGVAISTSSINSYAFQRATTGIDSIKNNLFVNVRSNSAATTPKHYAIRLNNLTTLSIDNNDYLANGTGGVLGVNNTTDLATLAAISTATGQDASSVNIDPLFNTPTGTAATVNLHINAGAAPIAIAAAATPIVSITTDIDNDARPGPVGSVNGGLLAPDMGADEFDGKPTLTCYTPSNLTASAITSTTATLSWTASPSAPPSYDIYYGLSPLTAPTASTTPTATSATTSLNITGLTAGIVAYQYYVRSACGGTNGSSNWAGPYTFSTLCGTVTTFPYLQSFSSTLPSCWTATDGASGATYYWAPTTADATYGVAGPQSGSNFMYLYVFLASTTYNPYYLTTIPFVLPATPKQLSYYYFLGNSGYKGTTGTTGTDPYPLTVQASIDGGTTWTDIYYHSSTNSTFGTSSATTNWQLNTISLAAYANQTVVLRFKSVSNYGSGTCDQGLDEFLIQDAPTCNNPTLPAASSITTTGATISWTAPIPSPTNYQLYYSTSSTAPTSSTTPTYTGITTTSYALTGLSPATTYYVWVRSNCGTNGTSTWSSNVIFSTLCLTSSLPVRNGFNSTAIPTCWSQQYPNGTAGSTDLKFQGSSSNPATTPYEGADYIFFNSYSSPYSAGIETRLVSPVITTTGTASVGTDFYWYNENSTSYNSGNYLNEGVTVQYSLDGITWTDVQFFPRYDATLASGVGQWKHKVAILPSAAGNQSLLYVGYKFHSEFGDNLSMDTIRIDASATFPVALTNFKGDKQGASNVLSWTTLNETNNKGFELQRSVDGVQFSSIGFLPSKAVNGISQNSLDYQFSDDKPFSGNSYYRLKQIDKDSKETYSQIVLLTRQVKNVEIISMAPNPVTSQTILTVAADRAQSGTIIILDATGRVLSSQSTYLNSGNNRVELSLNYLAAGTYNLQVVTSGFVSTQRFIKQ